DAALDQNRHGFGAFVAHHLADQGALEGGFGFGHGWLLHLAASRCFSAKMVLARAMARRVSPSVAVLLSCWVAFCMRRPKWAFCSDLISASMPATSFWRSSADFIACSPESLTQHARHERGAQGK